MTMLSIFPTASCQLAGPWHHVEAVDAEAGSPRRRSERPGAGGRDRPAGGRETRGLEAPRPAAGASPPSAAAGVGGVPDEGDGAAGRSRLVLANLGLVAAVARGYRGMGLELDDLIGEGNLGLIRAARRFDPSRGTRFSTFATHCIRQAIRDALGAGATTIRIPSWMAKVLARWRRAARSLSDRNGYPPTDEQVASHLGLTEPQRRKAEQALRALRLRAGAPGGEGGEAGPVVEAMACDDPRAGIEEQEERGALARRLARLDVRERAIVALRYGLDGEGPRTYAEIARQIGVSHPTIRKLEERAFRKLGRDPVPALTRTPGARARGIAV